MPLWQLTPIDEADQNWQASSYRGTAIVRAKDETTARKTAEKAFGIKSRFPPAHGVVAPPWLRPNSVRADLIEDQRYEAEGPAMVLFPPID